MGNEDIVACKSLQDTDKSNIIADIEALKEGLDSLNLDSNKDYGDDGKISDFVHILPRELAEEIFVNLSAKDLASCCLVSTSWREAVNSNKIWAHLCEKNGWKDDFDPTFSHFYKAHKQFRTWGHSYNAFTPMCLKRLLYNKHCCLQKNWRTGNYIAHKISNDKNSFLQLFEPVSCDGRYLVLLDKIYKFSTNFHLGVWSLDGVPHKIQNLTLPNRVKPVESIAFDYDTVAVAQSWVITVYHVKSSNFKMAFTLKDLSELEPKNKLPEDMKRMVPFLKITQDFIISVPNNSHNTVDYIPIFFWDKETGDLKHSLCFDSICYWITNVVWFNHSCYLSTVSYIGKTYQITEFGTQSAKWEAFSQSVTMEVEGLTACDQYILAVTNRPNTTRIYVNSRPDCSKKELWLWDRVTGSALKSFDVRGKGFQFVNDYLMYFEGPRVTVMDPKDRSLSNEFETTGTITSITATPRPSQLVILKTGCYIEVWDWGRGCRLYTVAAETGYGSQLWCDGKRIITYHSVDSTNGGGILVLGFW